MVDPTLTVYVRCNAADPLSKGGTCGAEMTPLNPAMDGTEVVLPGIPAETGHGHCENCGADLKLTPAIVADAVLELLKRLHTDGAEDAEARAAAINDIQHGCLVALGEA